MQLETFCFTAADGWSIDPLPSSLDSDRTLLVAFGDSALLDEPEPLHALRRAYPRSHLIGCSTAGEILDAALLRDGSLTVAAARFDAAGVATATASVHAREGSFEAGAAIARQLAGPELRAVLLFSDGLQVNGSELVRGLNAVLGPDVVITGGLAGDGSRFARTWVLVDGAPRAGFVAAAGLYGPTLRIGYGSKGGWDAFGLERVVTRSAGNVLLELDGQPALPLYKEYLGDLADGLPATGLLFPLAIRVDPNAETSLVRTILAVDEQEQSLTFAGDIPEGARAQLMRANFERLIDGAAEAASAISGVPDDGATALSIAVSCVGRRLVLGRRVEDEIEATLDALPAATRQVGFYSYGELSPTGVGSCDLHNQTMTLTLIGEGVPG